VLTSDKLEESTAMLNYPSKVAVEGSAGLEVIVFVKIASEQVVYK